MTAPQELNEANVVPEELVPALLELVRGEKWIRVLRTGTTHALYVRMDDVWPVMKAERGVTQ